MRRVLLYAGSSTGARESYAAATRELVELLVGDGAAIVYGGGRAGLMGVIADHALALGAEVTGVIPAFLRERELAHPGVELRIVDSMHERKALMADLADWVIAVPGGIGTLEELVEMLTWSQLGLHEKPIGLLNADGYYDRLLAFLDHAVAERFLTKVPLLARDTPADLVDALRRSGG